MCCFSLRLLSIHHFTLKYLMMRYRRDQFRRRSVQSVFLLLACTLISLDVLSDQSPPNLSSMDEYAGAETCRTCHEVQYEAWTQSDHYRSMLPSSEKSVLGDFSGKSPLPAPENNFVRDNEQFVFETTEYGKLTRYNIEYVFGHYPLQQYLVSTGSGRLQALNLAWDARSREEGGARWFDLRAQESVTEQSPFFWQRSLQNWNGRCAECHSTNVRVNYDAKLDAFDTQFSAVNVSCEACHGAGRTHSLSTRSEDIRSAFTPLTFAFAENDPIAHPVNRTSAEFGKTGARLRTQFDMCGGCHSRRTALAESGADLPYHQKYALALPEAPLYHPDGQPNEEVFVLGSFLQSRMYAAGVTCTNCHEPHSGKVRAQGNQLCAQCHKPAVFDTTAHHGHAPQSTGSQCVECHMPNTTYMTIDERRDHRFGIPDPALSQALGTPDPCANCHTATNVPLALSGSTKAPTKASTKASSSAYAKTLAQLLKGDPLIVHTALSLIDDKTLAAIRRGTLLAALQYSPSPAGVESARRHASNPDPLIRTGVAKSLAGVPLATALPIFSELADDPELAVRIEVARQLSASWGMASREEKQRHPEFLSRFQQLMSEYEKALSTQLYSPAVLTEKSTLQENLDQPDAAMTTLRQALELEQTYVPAMLNLGDHFRTGNEQTAAQALLSRAVQLAPDSGAANFSYGLALVRDGKTSDALAYLAKASSV